MSNQVNGKSMKVRTFFGGCTLLAVMLSACINNDEDLYQGNPNAKEIMSEYVMTSAFEVPIEEGSYTVVKYGDDTLYYGNVAMEIDVPKFSMAVNRAADEELKWYFVPKRAAGVGTDWSYTVTRSGILLFEDLTDGDSDYNDFVCALVETVNFGGSPNSRNATLSNIRVKPLAMGNTLALKFGVEFRWKTDGRLLKDVVVAEDVRKNFFGGKTGYINTTDDAIANFNKDISEKANATGSAYLSGFKDNELCVLWYIETAGVKRYVADSQSNLLSQDLLKGSATDSNIPFGLFVPNVIEAVTMKPVKFKWTKEKASLFQAYPDFGSWLKGEVNSPFGRSDNSKLFDLKKMGL